MMPVVLMGSLVGTFLNMAMPEFLLILCMTLLLSFLTYKTFKKGMEMYKKESIEQHYNEIPGT